MEQLNEIEAKLPVIIISGEGTQEETIKAIRLGANDYVTKENIEDELFERVNKLLERSTENSPTYQLIQNGENEAVEFKSTLRINLSTKQKDNRIQHSVLKTIAAFLNSKGGVLFIGVSDQGELLGVENDHFQNEDKMLQHLINIIKTQIGVQFVQYLTMQFKMLNNIKILMINCRPSKEPAYLKFDNKEYFFIRTGPATNALQVSKIHAYIKSRF